MKILVVAPSWVGDMVLAHPLLQRLHQKHPALTLDLLAPPASLGVCARMPEVHQTIAADFSHGQWGFIKRWQLARRLRENGYDQAIVLPNSLKSALIPFWANIALRTGFRGEMRYGLLNDLRLLDKQKLPQMAQRFALLAEKPNQPLPTPLPNPCLTAQTIERHTYQSKNWPIALRPLALLCPGAEYGPAKRWPTAYFARLSRELDARGYEVWSIGSQKDKPLGEEIQALSSGLCRNLCGQTSLVEAIDLIATASLVVTNDSGLMHVAAALHRPLIALYGSSSPHFTPPLSDKAHIVSESLACSPCFERECPLGHFQCMKAMNPEKLFEFIPKVLPTASIS